MPLRRHGRIRRAGFTLIEVLVVIAIIAVLVSLTTAAVMKARSKGPEVQERTEIAQLVTGLTSCSTDLGLDVIPSRLVLREDGLYNPSNANHAKTIAVLQKMFGRNFNVSARIDWNGNGSIQSGDIILEGQHCLVFFLGGIPTPPGGTDGCTGFSTNKANPAAAGGTRYGPYFEFKSNRLKRDANGFFTYLDAFEGQPYAYFSATKAGNDYTADCPALGVQPYFDLSRRFLNPNSYQIISAGPDKQFGPGGQWDPKSGLGRGVPGSDDMTNFSRAPLSEPQQ